MENDVRNQVATCSGSLKKANLRDSHAILMVLFQNTFDDAEHGTPEPTQENML